MALGPTPAIGRQATPPAGAVTGRSDPPWLGA